MELSITAKLRLYVSKDQQAALDETMDVYRRSCNYVAEHINCTHDLLNRHVHDALYNTVRDRFGLKSQMTESVFRTVIARYNTILKNEDKWIKPIFKKPQYDLVWNRDYSLKGEMVSINTLQGRLKFKFNKAGMEKYFESDRYRFGTAKLIKKRENYFLHVSIVFDVDEPNDSNNAIVGIDRGINFLIATYDNKGESGFVNGGFVKQKRAKYSQLRADLQRRRTPSARRRLKAIGDRENRWMQDVNHCISKALVMKYPENTLFVLEDLSGVREATERVQRKNRYISVSWAFYDLELKLTYKAMINKSKVIKVDPAYTSQTCPVCGHVEKLNRDKKNHRFCCKACGYRSNDDRVAAMNLYQKGMKYIQGVPNTVA